MFAPIDSSVAFLQMVSYLEPRLIDRWMFHLGVTNRNFDAHVISLVRSDAPTQTDPYQVKYTTNEATNPTNAMTTMEMQLIDRGDGRPWVGS